MEDSDSDSLPPARTLGDLSGGEDYDSTRSSIDEILEAVNYPPRRALVYAKKSKPQIPPPKNMYDDWGSFDDFVEAKVDEEIDKNEKPVSMTTRFSLLSVKDKERKEKEREILKKKIEKEHKEAYDKRAEKTFNDYFFAKGDLRFLDYFPHSDDKLYVNAGENAPEDYQVPVSVNEEFEENKKRLKEEREIFKNKEHPFMIKKTRELLRNQYLNLNKPEMKAARNIVKQKLYEHEKKYNLPPSFLSSYVKLQKDNLKLYKEYRPNERSLKKQEQEEYAKKKRGKEEVD